MAELALPHHINPSSKSFVSVSKKKRKKDAPSALHSNRMCVFVLLLPVFMSRRLGGLYFNCDKVEPLL